MFDLEGLNTPRKVSTYALVHAQMSIEPFIKYKRFRVYKRTADL